MFSKKVEHKGKSPHLVIASLLFTGCLADWEMDIEFDDIEIIAPATLSLCERAEPEARYVESGESATSPQWWSTNQSIMQFDENDRMIATGVGEASISASTGLAGAHQLIMVDDTNTHCQEEIEVVFLEPDYAELEPGDSINVRAFAVIYDSFHIDVTDYCAWETSALSVAEAAMAEISGVSPGETFATATCFGATTSMGIDVTGTDTDTDAE